MPANGPESPIAHIYAPRFPQEPIDIMGNKLGLEPLINILIDAVGGKPTKGPISTYDGFDSEIRAVCLEGKRRPEEWRRAGSPHWDVEDARIARILDLTEENTPPSPGYRGFAARAQVDSEGRFPGRNRPVKSVVNPSEATVGRVNAPPAYQRRGPKANVAMTKNDRLCIGIAISLAVSAQARRA